MAWINSFVFVQGDLNFIFPDWLLVSTHGLMIWQPLIPSSSVSMAKIGSYRFDTLDTVYMSSTTEI